MCFGATDAIWRGLPKEPAPGVQSGRRRAAAAAAASPGLSEGGAAGADMDTESAAVAAREAGGEGEGGGGGGPECRILEWRLLRGDAPDGEPLLAGRCGRLGPSKAADGKEGGGGGLGVGGGGGGEYGG